MYPAGRDADAGLRPSTGGLGFGIVSTGRSRFLERALRAGHIDLGGQLGHLGEHRDAGLRDREESAVDGGDDLLAHQLA